MTTITQERAGHKRVGYDGLVLREEWGARFGNYDVARSVDEPADTQHVHISVTNPGNYSSDAAHIRAIEAIGIARFGQTGVSYNRGFTQSGRAYELQPIGRRGAHTVNDFKRATCSTSGCPGRGGSLQAPSWNNNVTGRAYVICQNVGDAVTDAQVDALARCMAADRLAGFVRMDARIHGHRCCSSKSCPGDRMWARMGELKQLVDHYLRVGVGSTPTPEPEEDEDMKLGVLTRYGRSVWVYFDLVTHRIRRDVSDGTAGVLMRNPFVEVASPAIPSEAVDAALALQAQADAIRNAPLIEAVKAISGVDGAKLAADVAAAVNRIEADDVADVLADEIHERLAD